MKKYIFAAVFSLALLVSPAFTQAAALTQTQINAIVSLLQSFGADSAVVARVNSALTGDTSSTIVSPPPVSASTSPSGVGGQSGGSNEAKPGVGIAGRLRVCSVLQRNLSQGTQGDDVRSLQEFLGEEGQLSVDAATGYFGPMTAQAVAKWQVAQGVQGVGAVGPLTRERIKIWCDRFPPPDITNCIPRPACLDATPSCLLPEPVSGWCPAIPPTCIPRPACLDATPSCLLPEPVGGWCFVTVNKPPPGTCTDVYMPVCGQPRYVCPAGAYCTANMPAPKTYSNLCALGADGATLLYKGECSNSLSATSSTTQNNWLR